MVTVSLNRHQEERDSVENLRHQIMALMNQVALQRNKESALSKLLIDEQNEKAELLQVCDTASQWVLCACYATSSIP